MTRLQSTYRALHIEVKEEAQWEKESANIMKVCILQVEVDVEAAGVITCKLFIVNEIYELVCGY